MPLQNCGLSVKDTVESVGFDFSYYCLKRSSVIGKNDGVVAVEVNLTLNCSHCACCNVVGNCNAVCPTTLSVPNEVNVVVKSFRPCISIFSPETIGRESLYSMFVGVYGVRRVPTGIISVSISPYCVVL